MSQNLRSITKAREHGYKEVSLTVRPTFASIQLDRPRWPDCDKIKYISQDDGSCNVVLGGKSSKIEGISYVKAAVNDLAQLMDNPKREFEVMRLAVSLNGHPLEFEEIHDDDPLLEIKNRLRREISVKIADALNGVKIQFQVETLIIRETNMPAIVSMVSRFKPGKVERIHISRYKIEENREPVDELVNLEQWKTIKHIETNTVSEIHLQIDHVMHSKRFEIAKETFSEEEAIQIRDVSAKNSGLLFNNHIFTFRFSQNRRSSKKVSSNFRIMITKLSEKSSTRHTCIPGPMPFSTAATTFNLSSCVMRIGSVSRELMLNIIAIDQIINRFLI